MHYSTSWSDGAFAPALGIGLIGVRPRADSHKRLIFYSYLPLVQHRFDVFFYILGLWANE